MLKRKQTLREEAEAKAEEVEQMMLDFIRQEEEKWDFFKAKGPSSANRRWAEMDHEILIYIMKRYKWDEWLNISMIFVCKSWRSAFLDALFPPAGEALDLRVLDDNDRIDYSRPCSIYGWRMRRFYICLKLHLDANYHYTKVVLPQCILNWRAYETLGRRFVEDPLSGTGRVMFQEWQSLEKAHCSIQMLWDLATYCKSIRCLTLIGDCRLVHDVQASVIAEEFPVLDLP